MERYIDGEKLLEYYEERYKNLCKKNGETDAYCQGYNDAMYVAEHIDFTADVVPKSEVDLYRKQVDELEDELASTYDKLENAKCEFAREIFDLVELKMFCNRYEHIPFGSSERVKYYDIELEDAIAELKKKYVEGEG